MTTILADHRLGVMVADSNVSDGDRVWLGRKVFRIKGELLGFSGDVLEAEDFRKWWRAGRPARQPKFSNSQALLLSDGGLWTYNGSCHGERIARGMEAIGSGAKAAMCAYEAMAFADPVRAVKIVCHHDNGSRAPVRTYLLCTTTRKS